MGSEQTVANGEITVFEDEDLLHEIQPAFVEQVSAVDVLLTLVSMGLWLVVPYLRWGNTWYVITDTRLIEVEGGLTGTTTTETTFDDVGGDIQTRQSLLEKPLNRGTIEFEIEKRRRQTASEREFGDREGAHEEMEIHSESITLDGIRDYQEVSTTIRRMANA